MIDSDTMGCPEQKSAGCHFGTLGRIFSMAKTKWPPDISGSNMFFQQIKPGTSVIPHFYVIIILRVKVIFKIKKSIPRSNKQKYPF